MPGFPVLNTIQPILGTDMHKAIPPPPPAPPPMVPHVVVWGVGMSQNIGFPGALTTSKAVSPASGSPHPVSVGPGHACGRTHDAGPHPAHIWPNILLPVIMLGSASKAEFGAGTVKVTCGGQATDMAVNVAYIMNTNLQCNDFPLPATPTGFAMTITYNVTAGFGLPDLLRGMVQMLVDIAISWVVGAACAVITGAVSGLLKQVMNQSCLDAMGKGIASNFALDTAPVLMNDGAGFFRSSGRLFIDAWSAMLPAAKNAFRNAPADQVVNALGAGLGTFGLGSPLGYSPGYTPVGGGDKSIIGPSGSSMANQWVDGLFR